MKAYIQVTMFSLEPARAEILIANLSDSGFYAFEEDGSTLHAFIEKENFCEADLRAVLPADLRYETHVIQEENWNQQWEQHFEPVVLRDFAAVRASFHETVPGVAHEIIITPRMSFGTGHHATTLMMMDLMSRLSFRDKTVLDFGTGTGVLAILAEKLGASRVTAIDHDAWSISNALENIIENRSTKIDVFKADDLTGLDKYDIVLANINLNVLISNAASLADITNAGGNVLLSGFLVRDQNQIEEAFTGVGFQLKECCNKRNWLAMTFIRR